MNTTTLEIQLSDDIWESLEYISTQTDRSTHAVALEILKEYLQEKVQRLKSLDGSETSPNTV